MVDEPRLVARSVSDFVASVASIDEPVPAGGSVAALTGASSAALLALVCGVLDRRGVDGLEALRERAADLQRRLVVLVDEDAEAFQAYLLARRANEDVAEGVARASDAPLAIARACLDIVALSEEVEPHTSGPMLGDVRAARHLATAASASALDLAEEDVQLHAAEKPRQALRYEISLLRRRLPPGGGR